MARQRDGQSRRFNLLVAIATVLCFLHLPINGSQTLAVPGSGAEARRARLEKLKELKTKLLEKGLKVSGRKADLVERLMEALPKTRKIPQAQEPTIFEYFRYGCVHSSAGESSARLERVELGCLGC